MYVAFGVNTSMNSLKYFGLIAEKVLFLINLSSNSLGLHLCFKSCDTVSSIEFLPVGHGQYNLCPRQSIITSADQRS